MTRHADTFAEPRRCAEPKPCAFCGEPFMPARKSQRYGSLRCYGYALSIQRPDASWRRMGRASGIVRRARQHSDDYKRGYQAGWCAARAKLAQLERRP